MSFKDRLQNIFVKLSCSNGMLAKVKHYVSFETFLNIYHAIFNSHLRYQVWGHSRKTLLHRISFLQRKALRLIFFQPPHCNYSVLIIFSNILPFHDLVHSLNCFLVWEQQNSRLLPVFNNLFIKRTVSWYH